MNAGLVSEERKQTKRSGDKVTEEEVAPLVPAGLFLRAVITSCGKGSWGPFRRTRLAAPPVPWLSTSSLPATAQVLGHDHRCPVSHRLRLLDLILIRS